MQSTGKPSALSSCQSQVVVGPVSRPIRFAFPAFALRNSARANGSESTLPSDTILPLPSTTQIDVSLSDTSNPTYASIAALLIVHHPESGSGQTAQEYG